MEIEIRLKKILKEHGLDQRGVTKRLAQDLKVHRHTIGKIYRNEVRNPSLKVLGQLADWLKANGVPPEKLPQALLGSKPSKLWQAVASPGIVRLYLGEYQQSEDATPVMLWISRRDGTVAGEIVRVLSTPAETGEHQPMVSIVYVPFRSTSLGAPVKKSDFHKDAKRSTEIFHQMRSRPGSSTSILIGSQRVNYLVENLVADLFGCEPFQPTRGRVRVPFYLAFRSRDRSVLSCFGGLQNPPGRRGAPEPGIYYLGADGKWVLCPYESRREDAGVVITVYDPGTKGIEMVVFGFSGWATEAMGRHLLREAEPFWPPYVKSKGKEIGIYICRFAMEAETLTDSGEVVNAKNFKTMRLDGKTLTSYLA